MAGILLGAVPGVHQNLLSLLPLAGSRDLFETVFAAIFSSIIPTLLMAPSPETVAVLLPGQKMAGQGRIGEAVSEFLGGAVLGSAMFIIMLPLYEHLLAIPRIFSRFFWLPLTGFAMVPIVRNRKKWKASLGFFLLSGAYGWLMLKLPYTSESLLMAHFGGMFGLSSLLTSGRLAKQKVGRPEPVFKFASSFVGLAGGMLISLFPALTPAQASAFVFALLGRPENQLAAAGAMSTSAFLFCFLSLKFLAKPRSIAVQRIGNLHLDSVIFVAGFAYATIMWLVPAICRVLSRWDLRKPMAVLLILLIGIFSKSAGWIALPSLALGVWCHRKGVEKVNLMGSLMLPTIAWYLMH